MPIEVVFQEEIEWDHSKSIEDKPGLHVVECNAVDVRLDCVRLLVNIFMAEGEEDIKEEAYFNEIVEQDVLELSRSSKCSVVSIGCNRICC